MGSQKNLHINESGQIKSIFFVLVSLFCSRKVLDVVLRFRRATNIFLNDWRAKLYFIERKLMNHCHETTRHGLLSRRCLIHTVDVVSATRGLHICHCLNTGSVIQILGRLQRAFLPCVVPDYRRATDF